MTNRIFAILLFVLFPLKALAGLGDGMRFMSYEVPAEQRTSLVLPAGNHEWITFSDSLTVSFSLKIERDMGSFGYICRVALDDLLPIDLVMSPEDDNPSISATADHHNIVPIYDEGEDIHEWKDLYLRFYEDGGQLSIVANSREVFRTAYKAKRHRVRFFFGKVDAAGYATSDVAPMVLADLQVRADSRRSIAWMLNDSSDLTTRHGLSIRAVNPVFMRERNKHWVKIATVEQPSNAYACFSERCDKVWFVSEGQVATVDVPSAKTTVRKFGAKMKIPLSCSQFVVLPSGELALADSERGQMVRYDAASGEWEEDNGRTRTFTYLHGNTLYLKDSGKFIEIFGYGQHRYSNAVRVWSPEDIGAVCTSTLEGVEPRYLAGAGISDGKIYVLGGKGNESGRQELGVRLFDSLVETDPVTLSSRTLWENEILGEKVPAKDLVFTEEGIYTLLYNPEIHDSSLQLWRFNPEDGSAEPLADAIPYPFNDVSSEARLGFDRERETLVATVSFAGDDGVSRAEVWTVAFPVLAAPETSDASVRGPFIWALVAGMIAAAILLALAFLRLRRAASRPDETDFQPRQEVPKKPGVYLIGGFHVIDRDSNDIASQFSPILVQLLSILVIYTVHKGGVSNAKLKSLLWDDKSDSSFNNNKGVNISRLRVLLSQVGEITIAQDGGLWRIEDGAGLCDYIVAIHRIEGEDASLALRTASWGPLLPEYHYEWLDSAKARYTDLVLSRLDSMADDAAANPELAVRVADCRLLFDTLDEDAVRSKCQALVTLGRVGTAKAVFERFTSEYKNIMGEEFSKDFTSFLKNSEH